MFLDSLVNSMEVEYIHFHVSEDTNLTPQLSSNKSDIYDKFIFEPEHGKTTFIGILFEFINLASDMQ